MSLHTVCDRKQMHHGLSSSPLVCLLQNQSSSIPSQRVTGPSLATESPNTTDLAIPEECSFGFVSDTSSAAFTQVDSNTAMSNCTSHSQSAFLATECTRLERALEEERDKYAIREQRFIELEREYKRKSVLAALTEEHLKRRIELLKTGRRPMPSQAGTDTATGADLQDRVSELEHAYSKATATIAELQQHVTDQEVSFMAKLVDQRNLLQEEKNRCARLLDALAQEHTTTPATEKDSSKSSPPGSKNATIQRTLSTVWDYERERSASMQQRLNEMELRVAQEREARLHERRVLSQHIEALESQLLEMTSRMHVSWDLEHVPVDLEAEQERSPLLAVKGVGWNDSGTLSSMELSRSLGSEVNGTPSKALTANGTLDLCSSRDAEGNPRQRASNAAGSQFGGVSLTRSVVEALKLKELERRLIHVTRCRDALRQENEQIRHMYEHQKQRLRETQNLLSEGNARDTKERKMLRTRIEECMQERKRWEEKYVEVNQWLLEERSKLAKSEDLVRELRARRLHDATCAARNRRGIQLLDSKLHAAAEDRNAEHQKRLALETRAAELERHLTRMRHQVRRARSMSHWTAVHYANRIQDAVSRVEWERRTKERLQQRLETEQQRLRSVLDEVHNFRQRLHAVAARRVPGPRTSLSTHTNTPQPPLQRAAELSPAKSSLQPAIENDAHSSTRGCSGDLQSLEKVIQLIEAALHGNATMLDETFPVPMPAEEQALPEEDEEEEDLSRLLEGTQCEKEVQTDHLLGDVPDCAASPSEHSARTCTTHYQKGNPPIVGTCACATDPTCACLRGSWGRLEHELCCERLQVAHYERLLADLQAVNIEQLVALRREFLRLS